MKSCFQSNIVQNELTLLGLESIFDISKVYHTTKPKLLTCQTNMLTVENTE